MKKSMTSEQFISVCSNPPVEWSKTTKAAYEVLCNGVTYRKAAADQGIQLSGLNAHISTLEYKLLKRGIK